MDRVAAAIFEVLTVIGGLIAVALCVAAVFIHDIPMARGTEIIVLAIGLAVIPYCIAGALHRAATRRMMREDREA